jgi:hypothetical protein
MCAQTALAEERVQVQQEDFHGSHFSPNGDGVRLLSGDVQVLGRMTGVPDTLPAGPITGDAGEEPPTGPVVVEAMLVAVGISC